MNTVIIDIKPLANALTDFKNAWKTCTVFEPRISFATEELLWQTLTLEHWQILKMMAGKGELSIAEVAQQLTREIKTVQLDIQILLDCGLLNKTVNNKVLFPYDAVHVDFMMQAA